MLTGGFCGVLLSAYWGVKGSAARDTLRGGRGEGGSTYFSICHCTIHPTQYGYINSYTFQFSIQQHPAAFSCNVVITGICSLVPRPSPAPVFDRLQYPKTEGEGLVNLTM